MSIVSAPLPLVLAAVEVVSAERISHSYVRLVLGGPELADFGVDGPTYDQRIKLVFPCEGRPLPSLEGADESWLSTWMDRPVEERGHMRTYTVRGVVGSGIDTMLVVDVVVHDDGLAGPGARWASAARPGDRVIVVAPRRGVPFGGIEFAPPTVSRLLLVGDETAVPAVAGILAGLPADARGSVFLEVPDRSDIQPLPAPRGITTAWFARGTQASGDGEVGCALIPSVRRHVGLPPASVQEEVAVDPDLWETPTWSSSGEVVDEDAPLETVEPGLADLFAWIAGESAMVTRLRRALVTELGVDRRQVAFMGYWRRGVAMRS